MTCLHNHDQILEFLRKNIFERFSDLPKLSLCFKIKQISKGVIDKVLSVIVCTMYHALNV